MSRSSRISMGLAVAAALALSLVFYSDGTAPPDTAGQDGSPGEAVTGPVDGHDLPGVDTGRVAVGDPAPDFTLLSRHEGPVTLSDFRGQKEVVLVFYRGHW